MDIKPFKINISQSALDDLHYRLDRIRWPDEVENSGWDYGTNLAYMKDLVDYWQNHYQWREQEAALNQYTHYLADIDGYKIHFIHEHGKGPNPVPIIITHGWPGSFFEIQKLIPLLTDPARFGGNPADSFDVIIPSLPGFGFSSRPRRRGGMSLENVSGLWVKLMTEGLGYKRFAAAGGDFGAVVTHYIAQHHPELLIAMHLTYIGFYLPLPDTNALSEAEKRYLGAVQQWTMREGAYFMIQSTKPETLAFSMNDSPVGLAAWIVEKFHSWTDPDKAISKDELLTNIMLFWLTQTAGSSMRTYSDQVLQKFEPLPPVPAAFASFPKDINPPPREWVERRLHLDQWTQMPRGGHFAAMEEPELLAEDMRKFFHKIHETQEKEQPYLNASRL